MDFALGSGSQTSSNEPLRGFAALGALGGILGRGAALGGISSAVGRILGRGASVAANPSAGTAIVRRTGGTLPAVVRRGGLIAGAGAAFEAGSRFLPGGAPFPGDLSIPGFGSRGGGGAGNLQPGAPFGDTFITRVWQSGTTRDGVPIIHGMLANGKRFSTNRFGSLKTFRPRKNIVIGPDPKLSDARKVARAAKKMEKAATTILQVTGKKAVRRGS